MAGLADRFKPDPYVQPIVVRSVVLRPREAPRSIGPFVAHVTVISYPQCQIALVACGDHLAYGGPRASFTLTDERSLEAFTRVTFGKGRPCKRCMRRLRFRRLTSQEQAQYERWRDDYLRSNDDRVPAWIAEALDEQRLKRMPLVIHEVGHPFWSAVRLWSKQIARNGG